MTVIETNPITHGLSGSLDDIRHREILDQLYRLCPEEKELLMELDNLFGDLWNEAELQGARRQGRLIQAALGGDIWVNEDGVGGMVAL
jgi:hypothetical protein